MTSFEAIQLLSARAARVARWAWWCAGGSMLGVFLVVLLVQLLVEGRFRRAHATIASLATLGAAAVIFPCVRFTVKRVLQWRASSWIDELARQEGLDARRLAESFTMDSW